MLPFLSRLHPYSHPPASPCALRTTCTPPPTPASSYRPVSWLPSTAQQTTPRPGAENNDTIYFAQESAFRRAWQGRLFSAPVGISWGGLETGILSRIHSQALCQMQASSWDLRWGSGSEHGPVASAGALGFLMGPEFQGQGSQQEKSQVGTISSWMT